MNHRQNAYRKFRRHPLVEWLQYRLRRDPLLRADFVGLERKVSPGGIIIDGGANVGDITSLFARTGAQVHAFEPNPTTFSILRRRFRIMPNVQCYNTGLMDQTCILDLTTPHPDAHTDSEVVSVSSSFTNRFEKQDPATLKRVSVQCVDIAAFVEELGAHIDVLKLDIEGCEIAVVDRLISSGMIERIDLVLVETHERFSAELAAATEAMRKRIAREGLTDRFFLSWP